MKTDDIIKPSHDSVSSDSNSSAGDAAPMLDNIGLRENVILDEEPSILDTPSRESVAPAAPSVKPAGDGAHDPMGLGAASVNKTAVRTTSTRKPKLRNLNAEQAYELLASARTADHVELFLRDGRVIDGAILFNDIKGTGRIINVTKEISVDFRAENVRDIRF